MPKYQPGGKIDRQYGKTLEEIRWDHIRRYKMAAEKIRPRSRVADVACGCGYGSWMLHSYGHDVTGVDISQEAIEYGEKHYPGPLYVQSSAHEFSGQFDVLVTFETIEHIEEPGIFLRRVQAPLIIASVPNEEVFKFDKEKYEGDEYPHLRHYRPKELEGLLGSAGYVVSEWFCQKNKKGEITPGTDGMFLIALAEYRAG